MKISVEKLVANRANAQRSTGPQSSEGKLRSAKNASKHGLSASPNTLSSLSSDFALDSRHSRSELQAFTKELITSGYSAAQSKELIDALISSRQVIQAKHEAYTDRLNDKRMGNISIESLIEGVREMTTPGSGVTGTEVRTITMLLYREVLKDNNLSGLLFEKLESHRKLMRYEQRAFNQLRKKSQVKK